MKRIATLVLPLVAASYLVPALQCEASAQQINGLVGVGFSTPSRDLGVITVTGIGAPVQFTTKLESSPNFRGGLEGALADRADLRLTVGYGTSAVSMAPSLCDGGFDCSEFDRGEGDVTMWDVTGTVAVRASQGSATVRPFFLAGVAVRGMNFDTGVCSAEEVTCQALDDFLEDQTTPAAVVGAGLSVGRGGVQATLDLSAYVNGFSAEFGRGETQNDFVFTAGLRVPILGGS